MSQNAQTHFDKIASKYEKVTDSWKSVYDKVRQELEPLIQNKTVLDIGNGGFFPYDTKLPQKLIALDISPEMLDRIQVPGLTKIVGDATNLDVIEDNSVDIILFILAIHHINGPSVQKSYDVLDSVIQSSRKKLRSGGSLIIVEPTLSGALYFLEKLFFWPLRVFLGIFKVSMIFFFSPERLRITMAKGFGLKNGEIREVFLPIQGTVDPMGGSFPGLIKIPGSLSPTQYYLFQAIKA